MFDVDTTNRKITMHCGDTGTFAINITGRTIASGDRCLVTFRNKQKQIVRQSIMPITDGKLQITFANDDTQSWTPGLYDIEVRYVADPVIDQTTGSITNGSFVRTARNTFTLDLREVEGEI